MVPKELIAVMSATAIRARVVFNGATVLQTATPAIRKGSMRLTPWTLVGPNRLVVEIGALPEQNEPSEEPALSVQLYYPSRGAECTVPVLVTAFVYRPEEYPPLRPDGLTEVFSHIVDNQTEVGPWAWEKARPYRSEDRPAIDDVLTRFGDALAVRDQSTIANMLRLKTAEICKALGMDVDETEHRQFDFFGRYFDDEDWSVALVAAEERRIEAEANGRLVRVVAADGGPLYRGRGSGRPFAFNVVLTCVDDTWLIVR